MTAKKLVQIVAAIISYYIRQFDLYLVKKLTIAHVLYKLCFALFFI